MSMSSVAEQWVNDAAALTAPSRTEWCDGSKAEYDRLIEAMLRDGTLLAALLTVTVWKFLTGGVHLDGLADCLDGLVGRDAEHRLAIMRDSRIGAFGAVGLILFLMLEIVALAELVPPVRGSALFAAPVIARATPAVLAALFRPARADGQGAAFHAGVRPSAIAIGLAAAAAAASFALGGLGVATLSVGLVAAVAVGAFVATRLGGVTGDVLGAAVEISEVAVLLTVSAWTYAARV